MPDRKPLRAALATLGGLRRTVASSPALVASCISVVGCTHHTRLVPLSPDAVREATQQVEQRGEGEVVDRDGGSHDISRNTTLDLGYNEEVNVGSLIDACKAPRGITPCLLDRTSADWHYEDRHLTVDTGKVVGVAGLASVAALVYGNYECFGPGCSTGAKVAVGLGDAIVVVGTILLYEAFKNFGGVSASCGPLAPPCMPREEIA